MIIDGSERTRGDSAHAAKLKRVLEYFVEKHPNINRPPVQNRQTAHSDWSSL